jgi:hypothetical protein
MAGNDATRMSGLLSGDVLTCAGTRLPLIRTALLLDTWLSSACSPSNVELYVLNSVYLGDEKEAELVTNGEVGVVMIFVTEGDFVDVVGVEREDDVGVVVVVTYLGSSIVLGEFRSSDNRDL